jgi:hypothetical protein
MGRFDDNTPVWTEGISDSGGYDRYGPSPYSGGSDGLEIVASYDWADAYEFDMIVVWKKDGELRAAWDSGCSCPTPFADLTWEGMRIIKNPDDLEPLFDEVYHGSAKSSTDPGRAELTAKVHRELRSIKKEAEDDKRSTHGIRDDFVDRIKASERERIVKLIEGLD